jgi:serine/threonine protein kinase
MLLLPKTIGPVTLQRKLGSGPVSESYLGQTAEGRPVLVRRILPWILADAGRLSSIEARVADLRSVRHPLLVPVLDWVEVEGERLVVEEFIDGIDLERVGAWCRQQGQELPPNVFLNLATQVCSALEVLHGRPGKGSGAENVLHLGLQPGHIFVTPEARVVLGGFALWRSPTALPQSGVAGPIPTRLGYLSPEQTQNDQRLGPASDVFSLASILFELLTLRPMFQAESNLQTIHRVRAADVAADLAELKVTMPGLDRILYRALSRNPKHRYQRSFVLREDLRGLMAAYDFAAIVEDTQAFLAPLTGQTRLDLSAPAPGDSETTDAGMRPQPDSEDAWSNEQPTEIKEAPTQEATPAQPRRRSAPAMAPFHPIPGGFGTRPQPPEVKPPTPTLYPEEDVEGEVTDAQPASAYTEAPTEQEETRAFPPPAPRHTPREPAPTQAIPAPPTRGKDPEATQGMPAPPPVAPVADAGRPTAPREPETTQPGAAPISPKLANAPAPVSRPPTNEVPTERPAPAPEPEPSGSKSWLWIGIAAILLLTCAGVSAGFWRMSTDIDTLPDVADADPVEVPAVDEPTPSEQAMADLIDAPTEDPVADAAAEGPADPIEPPPVAARTEPAPTRTQPSPTRTEPVGTRDRDNGASSARSSGGSGSNNSYTPSADAALVDASLDDPIQDTYDPDADTVEATDLDRYASTARRGGLTPSDVMVLEMVTTDDPSYTRSRSLLLMNAEQSDDGRAVKRYLDQLMELPENQYNSVFLAKQAAWYANRKMYRDALSAAGTAERYWARIPPDLVFETKADIYETQAAAYQGLFYESEDDLDLLQDAVDGWEKYKRHVLTKGGASEASRADAQIAKLEDIRRRLE